MSFHRTITDTYTDNDGREFELPHFEDGMDAPEVWISPDGTKAILSYVLYDSSPSGYDNDFFSLTDLGRGRSGHDDTVYQELYDAWAGAVSKNIDPDNWWNVDISHLEEPEWTDEQKFAQWKMGQTRIDEKTGLLVGEVRYGFWMPDRGSQFWCDAITDGGDLNRISHMIEVDLAQERKAWADCKMEKTDEELLGAIDERIEACREEYERYGRGEVYGVVHATYAITYDEVEDTTECFMTHEESCWGFIGSEYAEEEMKSAHKMMIECESLVESATTDGGD